MGKPRILIAGIASVLPFVFGDFSLDSVNDEFSSFGKICNEFDVSDFTLTINEHKSILSVVNTQEGELLFSIDVDGKLSPIRPAWCHDDLSDDLCYISALCPIVPSMNHMTIEKIREINIANRKFKIDKYSMIAKIIQKARERFAVALETNKNNNNMFMGVSNNAEADPVTWDNFISFINGQISELNAQFPEDEASEIPDDHVVESSRRRLTAATHNILTAVNNFDLSNIIASEENKPSFSQADKAMKSFEEYVTAYEKNHVADTKLNLLLPTIAAGLPPTYDGRFDDRMNLKPSMKNCIKPETVLDQGNCGSCFAYATAIEMTYSVCSKTGSFFENNGQHTYSPKHLFDCWAKWDEKKSVKPCNSGGFLSLGKEQENQGARSEVFLFSDYTDSGRCPTITTSQRKEYALNGNCKQNKNAVPSNILCPCEEPPSYMNTVNEIFTCQRAKRSASGRLLKVQDIYSVDPNTFSIISKAAIYTRGSFRLSIRAPKFFQNAYDSDPELSTGKVFSSANKATPAQLSEGMHSGHATVAVGWGADLGGEYLIIQNSWGLQFGEKGFYRVYIADALFTSYPQSRIIYMSLMDLDFHQKAMQISKQTLPQIVIPRTEAHIFTKLFYLNHRKSIFLDEYGVTVGIEKNSVNPVFHIMGSPGSFIPRTPPALLSQYLTVSFTASNALRQPINFFDDHLTSSRAIIEAPMVDKMAILSLKKILSEYYIRKGINTNSNLYTEDYTVFDYSLICPEKFQKEINNVAQTENYLIHNLCKRLDNIDRIQGKTHEKPEVLPPFNPDLKPEPYIPPPVIEENPWDSLLVSSKIILFENEYIGISLQCKDKKGVLSLCNILTPAMGSKMNYLTFSSFSSNFLSTLRSTLSTVEQNSYIFISAQDFAKESQIEVYALKEKAANHFAAWPVPLHVSSMNFFSQLSIEISRSTIFRVSKVREIRSGAVILPIDNMCENMWVCEDCYGIHSVCQMFGLTPKKQAETKVTILSINQMIFNIKGKLVFVVNCDDDIECNFDYSTSKDNTNFAKLNPPFSSSLLPAKYNKRAFELHSYYVPMKHTLTFSVKKNDGQFSDHLGILDMPRVYTSLENVKKIMNEESIFAFPLSRICTVFSSDSFPWNKMSTDNIVEFRVTFEPFCSLTRYNLVSDAEIPKGPKDDGGSIYPINLPSVYPESHYLEDPSDYIRINKQIYISNEAMIFTINCGISSNCYVSGCSFTTLGSSLESKNYCYVENKLSTKIYIFHPITHAQGSIPTFSLKVDLLMNHPKLKNVLRTLVISDIHQTFMFIGWNPMLYNLIGKEINAEKECENQMTGTSSSSVVSRLSLGICQRHGWEYPVSKISTSGAGPSTYQMYLWYLEASATTSVTAISTLEGDILLVVPYNLITPSNPIRPRWFLDQNTLYEFSDKSFLLSSTSVAEKKYNIKRFNFHQGFKLNSHNLNRSLVFNLKNLSNMQNTRLRLQISFSFDTYSPIYYTHTLEIGRNNFAITASEVLQFTNEVSRELFQPTDTTYSNIYKIGNFNINCYRYPNVCAFFNMK